MNRLRVGARPPDFSLPDQHGNLHTLSEIYRSQNVLLVFNIGFV
jgi:peroxiredoxin